MKEHRVWVLATMVLFLVSGQVLGQNPAEEIDEVVAKWTASLNREDIDGFLSCYWDDAVRIVYFPGQDPEITQGLAELRQAEEVSFEEFDYQSFNLIYDEPTRFFPDRGNPSYIYPNSRFAYMDVFEFEERRGEFRIVRQYLFPHPPAE